MSATPRRPASAARLLSTLLGLCAWVAFARPVAADEYEDVRLNRVLEAHHWQLDSAPEGKQIAFVHIEREDVFVADEFWPLWLNLFHSTTREDVVRRELLLDEGDRFDEHRADETERNLRALGPFSSSRVVAVVGERPQEVGLLVVTRDLWSLRVEQSFQATGAYVNFFNVTLVERNFLGQGATAGVRFALVPDAYRIGQFFEQTRFLGEGIALTEDVDFAIGRVSGELEGSRGSFVGARPFYNLRQRFGFTASASYDVGISRQLRSGRVLEYDIPETAEVESIRRVWSDKVFSASGLVSYRLGVREGSTNEAPDDLAGALLHTLTAGLSYSERQVAPIAETQLSLDQAKAFERDVLPDARLEFGPVVEYSFFTPRYVTYSNLSTFAFREVLRTGPYGEVGARFPLRAFGSSSDRVVPRAKIGLVFGDGGGLLDMSTEVAAIFEDGVIRNETVVAQIRGATPVVAGLTRLVARLRWEGVLRDTSDRLVTLGGDNGLRGFQTEELYAYGGGSIVGGIELRSLPLVWNSIHLGFVAFCDMGGVYGGNGPPLALHYSAGIGLRFLLPQFNKTPLNLDGAIPLEKPFRIGPSFSPDQPIRLTEGEDRLYRLRDRN